MNLIPTFLIKRSLQIFYSSELKMFHVLLDNVFGRCCGGGIQGGGCGGYVGGKPALAHYKEGFFGNPHVTTWKRGVPADVYWTSHAHHRGGYAFRLCKVENGEVWKVTEECFNNGHLKFSGTLILFIIHALTKSFQSVQNLCK